MKLLQAVGIGQEVDEVLSVLARRSLDVAFYRVLLSDSSALAAKCQLPKREGGWDSTALMLRCSNIFWHEVLSVYKQTGACHGRPCMLTGGSHHEQRQHPRHMYHLRNN